ncbi:MAG TPA: PrsW family glutamic-type intramembrane protease, partial [Candidatus Gracilibacteria bacterium]|nr:PrsW family glutamic-type intramembrane protease [Candidatus Gracilibacteria bacterium]
FLALVATGIAGGFLLKDFSFGHAAQVFGWLIAYFAFLRIVSAMVKIRSIDDMLEVAIVAALGFAFLENIYYFNNKIGEISTGEFVFFAAVRVTVVTIVHVLCSTIMAYHLGMGRFARPVLKSKIRQGARLRFARFWHKILRVPSEEIFRTEQMFIGIILSIVFHALYDFCMQLQFQVFGSIPLFTLVIPVYFIGGLWYLFSLLSKKENHKEYNELISFHNRINN